MTKTMKSMCMVLTILIGVVSLCVNRTWANEQGPSGRSHAGIDVKQTLPAPIFNNNPQLDMILTNYRPMAIIFSGNNADWQYLPLFEFLIRVVFIWPTS